MTSLAQSYQFCEHIMKKHSKSFYQAFSLLPEAQFKAVTAIYAFCREADDIVDEADDETTDQQIQQALNQLEADINSIFLTTKLQNMPDYPWWEAFSHAVQTFQISRTALIAQIEGQRSDIHFSEIKTMEDLLDYSYYVAGSVGEMMQPLLVEKAELAQDKQLKKACIHLGIGMQITNILRDIGEDIRDRDRVYLPTSLLKEFRVDLNEIKLLSHQQKDQLVRSEIPSQFKELWEFLAHQADQYYQTILNYIQDFHEKARLPLVSAMKIYHAIQDEVRANEYNCLTEHAYTSKITKLKLIREAKKVIS